MELLFFLVILLIYLLFEFLIPICCFYFLFIDKSPYALVVLIIWMILRVIIYIIGERK